MSNVFNSVLQPKVGKNAFNLAHDRKLSTKFGRLTPVLVQETLPGDIFRGNSQCLMRFAPMLAPIMHRVDVYIHYFYVPNRILWPNWEDWITGNNDESEPPYFTSTEAAPYVRNGSTLDHLGMPSADIDGIVYQNTEPHQPYMKFNALPVAAFQRVWFEYYRDQNLEYPDKTAKDCMLVDGENDLAEVTIDVGTLNIGDKYRAWTKDYFTSALPWAQKGDAAMIPISGEIGLKDPWDSNIRTYVVGLDGERYTESTAANIYKAPGVTDGSISRSSNFDGTQSGQGKIILDSSEAYQISSSNTSIEDLRRAARMQEWLERNARGGTRYVESIYSHFNERVKDYRLDRPEYIGGSRNRVNISEVLQTSESTEEGTPQGEMAGHGISAGYSGSYNYRCSEHGFIVGVMSVRPTPAYFQGVPRHFGARQDRLDYYWPTFAHLGEQAIQNKELFLDMDNTEQAPDDTFGYTPRYAEYRMNYSTVSGDFNTSLEFWHMARKFAFVPALNAQFVRVSDAETYGDLDRIFAVQDGTDYLWCHIYHDIKAIRPIPKFAIPSL